MAKLLLDTHVFLWAISEPGRLNQETRATLESTRNEVFVSAVSGWEISIKRTLGKLQAPDNLEVDITERGFMHLPLTFSHAERLGTLPMHHRDPFDRMLVAQAQAEGLVLVTGDRQILRYDVRTMAT